MKEMKTLHCQHWSSRARLDALLQRLIACLPGVPGFRTLSLFGSVAEGRADGYSDIDMILTTDDLPAAQHAVLDVLEAGVGPVESCWAIALRPDEWNPTIIFSEEGYYHKLDLGLVASTAVTPTIPPEQTTVLVTQPVGHQRASAPESTAYLPPYGSVGHFLLGQLLGGNRYCKARKRGQPLTCYRFVSAAADWCLRALHVRLTGKVMWQGKLSTEEYAVLGGLDTGGRGRTILAALDYSTPEKMDQSLCGIFRHLYELCGEISAMQSEVLPVGMFERMLDFMRTELDIAEGHQP
jgi:predicted nucleotidyltransferase